MVDAVVVVAVVTANDDFVVNGNLFGFESATSISLTSLFFSSSDVTTVITFLSFFLLSLFEL